MRTSILAMVILPLSAPLHAQSTSPDVIPAKAAPVDRCRRFDSPPAVVVTMRDGQRLRGTLMCLGDEVELDALLGLVIDAATSSNKTIYKANIRSPAISLRLRF